MQQGCVCGVLVLNTLHCYEIDSALCAGAPMPPPPGSRQEGQAPPAQRQRTEFVLQPEDEFLEEHSGISKVH